MRKRIFKYKLVYYLSILSNFFLILLFGFGAQDSFIEFSLKEENIFSIMNFVFAFAFSIFLASLISLISLIFKWKRTILFLNVNYTLLLFFFLTGIIKMFVEDSFSEILNPDLIKFIVIFFVVILFIFITNYSKYNNDSFVEIDDIGNQKIS